MIPLIRSRQSGIPSGLTGKPRVKKNLTVLTAKRDGTAPRFSSAQWKPAKANLRKESRGKCAYCESLAETVAHCDVEHFRPKSVYWWLAYCYDNYLFSCQICNQSYKSDSFPVSKRMRPPTVTRGTDDDALIKLAALSSPDPKSEPDGMPWKTFDAACRRELAKLPNPYLGDPSQLLAWKADDHEKLVTLIARGSTPQDRAVVKACESYLGLNREELKRARYQAYRNLSVLCQVVKLAGATSAAGRAALQGIADACEDNQPYAGMARYFRLQWKIG